MISRLQPTGSNWSAVIPVQQSQLVLVWSAMGLVLPMAGSLGLDVAPAATVWPPVWSFGKRESPLHGRWHGCGQSVTCLRCCSKFVCFISSLHADACCACKTHVHLAG
jgi:hypothetical protein